MNFNFFKLSHFLHAQTHEIFCETFFFRKFSSKHMDVVYNDRKDTLKQLRSVCLGLSETMIIETFGNNFFEPNELMNYQELVQIRS